VFVLNTESCNLIRTIGLRDRAMSLAEGTHPVEGFHTSSFTAERSRSYWDLEIQRIRVSIQLMR